MKYICKVQKYSGEIFKTTIEAESKMDIVGKLEKQKLIPIKIKKKPKDIEFFESKIKYKELVFFFNNMYILLKAGLSLIKSLEIINDQTKHKKMKEVLEKMRKDISDGKSLNETMKERKVFPDLVPAMIKVGEKTGNLKENMKELDEYFSRKLRIKRSIKSALMYPVITMVIALFAIIGVSAFILPTIMNSLGGEPNKYTEILKGIAFLFTETKGLITLFGIIAIIFIIVRLLNTRYKDFKDKYIIKIPIIGKVIKTRIMVQFTTTLAVLVKSGVSITDSLDIIKGVINNDAYIKNIEHAKEEVILGNELSDSLSPKLFNKVVLNIIEVGEESGNMYDTLKNVGDYLNEELEVNIKRITDLITPISILFVGGFVVILALGILMPMFSVYNVT